MTETIERRPEHVFRQAWRTACKAQKTNTAGANAALAIIRGMLTRTNDKARVAAACLNSAFTPTTNKKKLENGQTSFDGLRRGLYQCRMATAKVMHKRLSGTETDGSWPILDCLDNDELKLFADVLSEIQDDVVKANPQWFDRSPKEFTYVFIRQDMSPEQLVVQTGHVMASLGHALSEVGRKTVDEINMAVIGVDEAKINTLLDPGVGLRVDHVSYKDSDHGFTTAIATFPVKGRKRRTFDKYALLRVQAA